MSLYDVIAFLKLALTRLALYLLSTRHLSNSAARLITAAITFAIQFNSISLATKTIVRTLVFSDVLTELT